MKETKNAATAEKQRKGPTFFFLTPDLFKISFGINPTDKVVAEAKSQNETIERAPFNKENTESNQGDAEGSY